MIANPDQKKKYQKKVRARIFLTVVIFLFFFGLLIFRAFQLHLVEDPRLAPYRHHQYTGEIQVAAKRGSIYDRHGENLAISIEVDSLYARPHLIGDAEKLAKDLAPILKISKANLLKKLTSKHKKNQKLKKFVWIKRRLQPSQSKKLRALNVQGIGLSQEYQRYYPNQQLAANLLGAVGYESEALGGIESKLDNILKSKSSRIELEKDAKGRSYDSLGLLEVQDPNEVVLSIDKTIQYITEKELSQAINKTKAKSGVAIVLEVQTGEILAMAVQPTFNPNRYNKYHLSRWKNRVVGDVFEPGSIFKAFTAAIALETQSIGLEQSLNCEKGRMKFGKHTIKDTHPYSSLKLAEIIKYSSNICSFKLAHRVGKEKFVKYLRDLGFGHPTGIETLGEESGFLVGAKRMKPIQLGTIGFGQGISATPLQMVMAYGAIANGGTLMKPLLVKEIRDSKGNVLNRYEPQAIRQVFSPKTSKKTIEILQKVVEKGGTGTRARLDGFAVAGKTGTAQKVIEGKKGYARNKYIASFIGIAPADQPRLVVLVSLDEPKGAYYGGVVSAPVFREIMGKSLAYLKLLPRNFDEDPSPSKKKVKKALVTKKQKPNKKPSKKNKDKLAKKNKDSVSITKSPNQDPDLIPNLTGLSVREVLRQTEKSAFKVMIHGSGICYQQKPAAGKKIKPKQKIVVQCRPI